jgi:hypothetical protein
MSVILVTQCSDKTLKLAGENSLKFQLASRKASEMHLGADFALFTLALRDGTLFPVEVANPPVTLTGGGKESTP